MRTSFRRSSSGAIFVEVVLTVLLLAGTYPLLLHGAASAIMNLGRFATRVERTIDERNARDAAVFAAEKE